MTVNECVSDKTRFRFNDFTLGPSFIFGTGTLSLKWWWERIVQRVFICVIKLFSPWPSLSSPHCDNTNVIIDSWLILVSLLNKVRSHHIILELTHLKYRLCQLVLKRSGLVILLIRKFPANQTFPRTYKYKRASIIWHQSLDNPIWHNDPCRSSRSSRWDTWIFIIIRVMFQSKRCLHSCLSLILGYLGDSECDGLVCLTH